MRNATVKRKTKETDISCTLNLDGKGTAAIKTGIGFFDHMLEGFTRHGFFDLNMTVKGDLNVDSHHSVEDAGIVLGSAIKEALGDKKGITRFGDAMVPMDDVLALCAVDLCGRPYLKYDVPFTVEKIGYLETELIREFFYAVSYAAGMNIHIKIINEGNNHHMAEAVFKAFARALDRAVTIDGRLDEVPSTKGSL